MGERILARREVLGADVVFGLLDGDFSVWSAPQLSPSPWLVENETVHLGWRWERKEVENYLIDPEVVARAFNTLPSGYEEALANAAERIANYQAARIALALNRPRFSPLATDFGHPRGRKKHPIPEDLSAEACLREVHRLALEWNEQKTIDEAKIDASFHVAAAECAPGGTRRQHFIGVFAGKDLLWAMNESLKAMGYASAAVFQERIMEQICNTPDHLDWLPEWRALRRIVAEQS
jgi:hypothetical protein